MNLLMKFVKAVMFTYAFFFVMLLGLIILTNLLIFTID